MTFPTDLEMARRTYEWWVWDEMAEGGSRSVSEWGRDRDGRKRVEQEERGGARAGEGKVGRERGGRSKVRR